MYRIIYMVTLFVLMALTGGAAVFVLTAWFSGYHILWLGRHRGPVPSSQIYNLIKETIAILAVAGAAFTGAYAYRKQRVHEADGRRADAESLFKRYQDAADQIGHERAAVRLAGVYAMARLADEWEEERQTCVDVLCAYLRMPSNTAEPSEDEVRRTIVSIICRHLMLWGGGFRGVSWSDLLLDFSGADLRNCQFRFCTFTNHVKFDDATFRDVDFQLCTFAQGASFLRIKVKDGALDLRGTTVGDYQHSELSRFIGFAGFYLASGATIKLSLELVEDAVALLNQGELLGHIDIGLDPTKHRDRAAIKLHHLKGTGSVTITSPRLEALPENFKTGSPMVFIDDVDNVRVDPLIVKANLVAYTNFRD
jgi:hypothetical protein